MVFTPLQLFSPFVHAVTLLITATSAVYILRQETVEYGQIKNLLIAVHALFIAIVSLEFVRNFYSDPLFMDFYTIGNTTFVLLDVALLTLVALAIYYRPKGAGLRDIGAELLKHRRQLVLVILYTGYLLAAEAFLLIPPRPYVIVQLINTVGSLVSATSFSNGYLNVLLGVLLVFIAYPSTLLFLASRRTGVAEVRRALIVLPVAWTLIGLDLLIFNGYLLTIGIDASAVGYLIAATAFSASALTFRRATVLSGFFAPLSLTTTQPRPTGQKLFSQRVGLDAARLISKNMLLEVDPVMNYEETIRDFALEFTAEGYVIFAFTSKGSPIYNALSPNQGVRFYTLTEKVSYARPSPDPREVLVPHNDISVLLNTLDKTLNTNPQLKMMIVFDSISHMLLSSGVEHTYKFIKQANEMLNVSKTTAVFLITKAAHTEKEINIVKSLFTDQLAFGEGGLNFSKRT
jgi:hypothetical protein